MHDLFSFLIVNVILNENYILWTRFYQVGGKHILVDPFISANPLAENVDINTIKADYILRMLTAITF
jgi:hypothetical protein